ncbi:hypothetical protein [Spirochaeta cellobiosiphila]|uniref:hypothetical protein n=1 Tax=Spirochaeta cellobiosiphila TaxID=504483 RepID=UPI001B7FDDDB|nr:hypothetical protein [Spirochaeta cellobiosiphila]
MGPLRLDIFNNIDNVNINIICNTIPIMSNGITILLEKPENIVSKKIELGVTINKKRQGLSSA